MESSEESSNHYDRITYDMLNPKINFSETHYSPVAVETMKTLLICRGPIAFETLEVYRSCNWTLPHVVVSAKEWIADHQCAAPWITNLPHSHVHYIEEYTNAAEITSWPFPPPPTGFFMRTE